MRSDWFHEIRSSDLFFNLLDSSSGCISQIPNPKKTSLQFVCCVFPQQNNHVNIVLNGMFNSFLGYQTKRHPRFFFFFFFFGAKNTHHVAATSWCTLPKCLARALSLPGGKFFFPASWKPGSHRRVSPCWGVMLLKTFHLWSWEPQNLQKIRW